MKFNEDKLAASLCKDSFYFFVQEFWSEVIPEEPVWNWHIEYLCGVLQEIGIGVKNREPKLYEWVIINIPPGTTKSTIISEMYPAWCWAIDPTQRFICSSNTAELSLDIAEKCRMIIKSDRYQRYFPNCKLSIETDSKSHFKNIKGGERYATSVGAARIGIHAHQLIIDDPHSTKQAESEADRKSATNWISRSLSTRVVSKKITTKILVMQRLHEMDATGYLLSKHKDNILHICLPAELTDDIKPFELNERYVDGLLDPIRLDDDALKSHKENLGSYGYAGQILQRPSPEEGGQLKKAWFKIIDFDQLPKLTWNFAVDSAYTEDEKNDPSALMAFAADKGNLYIRMSESVRLEFPELCKYIKSFVAQYGYTHASRIWVEPKASGKSIQQTLRKATELNILEGKNPTKDKVARVSDIAPTVEAGRVFLVRGSWNDNFLGQCAAFPNGQHDDEVDTLIIAVTHGLRKIGWQFVG